MTKYKTLDTFSDFLRKVELPITIVIEESGSSERMKNLTYAEMRTFLSPYTTVKYVDILHDKIIITI